MVLRMSIILPVATNGYYASIFKIAEMTNNFPFSIHGETTVRELVFFPS